MSIELVRTPIFDGGAGDEDAETRALDSPTDSSSDRSDTTDAEGTAGDRKPHGKPDSSTPQPTAPYQSVPSSPVSELQPVTGQPPPPAESVILSTRGQRLAWPATVDSRNVTDEMKRKVMEANSGKGGMSRIKSQAVQR